MIEPKGFSDELEGFVRERDISIFYSEQLQGWCSHLFQAFWLEDQKFNFGHVCLKSLLNFLVEISSRQLVTWVTY